MGSSDHTSSVSLNGKTPVTEHNRVGSAVFPADVDWCIRIMKEADRLGLPLVNANAIVANFEEGGDTTQHHRDSLFERFHVMATHYGYIQTFLLHCWFVLRLFKR